MTITIGQRLKAAREEQRLSLEKVFEATRIRVQYLQALEDDDLSVMPSPVQARGYLRNYAEFLGLNVEKVLEELRESSTQTPPDGVIGPADAPDEQAALIPEAELLPQETPAVEETSPLIKPKAARRKKKAVPPVEQAVDTREEQGNPVVEPGLEAPIAPAPIRQGIEEVAQIVPANPATLSDDTLGEPERAAAPEASQPFREEAALDVPAEPGDASPAEELKPESDLHDSLWQTWLNRLGLILAGRSKRQPSAAKEPDSPDESPGAESLPAAPPEPVSAVSSSDTGSENSTQIFKEIGRELRERRELLSLHLEEVERNTHVKAHYLDALERGAMEDLPSTVQTRGMLSNYATFLDLDVDTLLLRFADALQARYRERNPQKPVRKPGQPIVANLPPMRSFIAGDLIFGVGIGLLLVGFAVWGVSRVLTLQSQQDVEATAPSISEILLAPPEAPNSTATATLDSVGSIPGLATITVVIPTLNADVNVQVNLVAAERTYMRVTVDGEVVFEGRVVPGTAYPFEGEQQVEVLVGNGAAIRIVHNGRDLGLLGSFGQVVNNIYLANEIITPTGLPTATFTVTPTPTRTAVPSATPRLSATPAPSGTAVP